MRRRQLEQTIGTTPPDKADVDPQHADKHTPSVHGKTE